MLSKRKKPGVLYLNPLKLSDSNKWFAYCKDRFGSQKKNDERYERSEIVCEDNEHAQSVGRGTSSSPLDSGACSMKGNDSIVLPTTFKRPSSRFQEQGEHCKGTPTVASCILPRSLSVKGLDQREQLSVVDTHRRSSLSHPSKPVHGVPPTFRRTASSLRLQPDGRNATNLTAIQVNQAPAVREIHRNHIAVAPHSSPADRIIREPPVREDGRACGLTLPESNRGAHKGVGGDRINVAISCHAAPATLVGKHQLHHNTSGCFLDTARPVASDRGGLGRPSCSEESSSDTSDLSTDDAQDRILRSSSYGGAHVPRYDGSSCSSSGSVSPLSLNPRMSDLKLHRNSSCNDQHGCTRVGGQGKYHAFEKRMQGGGPVDVQAGLVGIQNEGNTCYLNSCLQCLAHTLPLASAVLGPYSDQIQKRGGHGARRGVSEREWATLAELLVYSFHQIIRDLWGRPSYSTASANIFLQCVQAFAPQFAGFYQHDAQVGATMSSFLLWCSSTLHNHLLD